MAQETWFNTDLLISALIFHIKNICMSNISNHRISNITFWKFEVEMFILNFANFNLKNAENVFNEINRGQF